MGVCLALEKEAWNAFVAVVSDFLRNRKPLNYDLEQTLLTSFQVLDCNISVIAHFLHSHLDCFFDKPKEIVKSGEKRCKTPTCCWLLLIPAK